MTKRPTFWPPYSANQRALSDPAVIPQGLLPVVGIRNSVTTPAVVIRPILLASNSVNQRFPSGPEVISKLDVVAGIENSVTAPAVVIRPILLRPNSVNQSAPSGPEAMPRGAAPNVGTGNSVSTPPVVMRPIRLSPDSVNQRAPSGPGAIS